MRLILIFIISLIQDPSYILDQRAEEEAERRYDEFWDCVDRGDCDPNDYPSPDSSFFDIILNPYYIILVVIMIILTNLDWFRSKKSKEKTERYIRYSDLSNRTHGEGGFIVYDNEIPVCAGFLYVTNSKTGWCDWIISNFEYKEKIKRKKALKRLITTLTHTLKLSGCKYAYALIKSDSLIKVYKEEGYSEAGQYNKEMIKIL